MLGAGNILIILYYTVWNMKLETILPDDVSELQFLISKTFLTLRQTKCLFWTRKNHLIILYFRPRSTTPSVILTPITEWKVSIFKFTLIRMRENADQSNSEYGHFYAVNSLIFRRNMILGTQIVWRTQ